MSESNTRAEIVEVMRERMGDILNSHTIYSGRGNNPCAVYDERSREREALFYGTVEDCIDFIRAKAAEHILTALEASGRAVVQGWQPIESAPKDRTILLGHPSQVPEAGWWEHSSWFEGWCCGGFRSDMYGPGFEPTHWMPLPAPPTSPYGKAVVKEDER